MAPQLKSRTTDSGNHESSNLSHLEGHQYNGECMQLLTNLIENFVPQPLQIEIHRGTPRNKLPDTTNLSYRFGFLAHRDASTKIPSATHNWRQHKFADFHIFVHPEANSLHAKSTAGTLFVVGDIYVAHGNLTAEAVLSKIIDGDTGALDALSGRFALFVNSHNDATRIFHDPFGARSIYYCQHLDCVASHSSLCAEACSAERDRDAMAFVELPEYRLRGTSYLPGDLTVYSSIKALTPNCYLDTGRRHPVRYWPRQGPEASTKEVFFSACDEYFTKTAAFLNKNYSSVLGLTGGVDTRSVIAGLVAKGVTPKLVTWTGNRLPEVERPVVAKMIAHLGLPHHFMDPGNLQFDDQSTAVANSTDRATGFCRGRSALSANMHALFGSSDVFIRGYGGEILRGFYNRHGVALTDDLVESLSRLYRTTRVASPSEFFTAFTRKAMSDFIERTGYRSDMHGLDVLDLFYWEQRMGVWGSNMLNEMDPALYSMVGLNSRTLYRLAFGLPHEYRLGTEIMLDITARYDIELSKMGIAS